MAGTDSRKLISSASKPRLMSDAAVERATGRVWKEWFKILDRAGAKRMTHQEIVAVLVRKHRVKPWWQQMVTVGYEKARGLRKVHERPDGYSISRSKTAPVPIATLYRAWAEPKTRGKWLRDPKFIVRKATPNRSMRLTWIDGTTSIITMFYPKGTGKSQVTVEHNKLPNAAVAEKMKKYWTTQLDRMAKALAH